MNRTQATKELAKCVRSPHYFIHTYCKIYHAPARRWVPFHLWPAQYRTLTTLADSPRTVILKARQLGLTWLVVAFALWTLIFQTGSIVLLFSRRDEEAAELLNRLRGMHRRLPAWLRPPLGRDSEHELTFPTLNSAARSFSAARHSGRSFTASLAIIDEADFIPWIRHIMAAVKPTVDAGGRLVVLSTPNKETPESEFKRLWLTADAGENSYRALFLPWSSHPDRDPAWYQVQAADMTRDDLYQEYPATPQQALSPRYAAARFDPDHLTRCLHTSTPLADFSPPAVSPPPVPIPNLLVYEVPQPGHDYLISADPAEGDPNSDPSAAIVWDVESVAEVAHLWGRFEPITFASFLGKMGNWYNDAVICVERNNHCHAVHIVLACFTGIDPEYTPRVYQNPWDGKKGWLSNEKFKTLAMDHAAGVFRDAACIIRTRAVIDELAGIRASQLSAYPGQHDDRAMAAVIGLAAIHWPGPHQGKGLSFLIPPIDPLDTMENSF